MSFPRPLPLGLALAAVVVLADQASKWWIVEAVMDPPRTIPLAPALALVLVYNRGVSFGLLGIDSAATPVLLSALALAVAVGLGFWLRRARTRTLALGLGLIIGGALGNVVDRVRLGAVVDFVLIHVGDWHWPAFNLADSAITLGVALVLLDGLMSRRETVELARDPKDSRQDAERREGR